MKIKPKLDRRGDEDYQKIDDKEWNALCRSAGLSRRQQILISAYLDKQMKRKINEVQAATKYGAYIYLREKYRFGFKRIAQFERGVTDVLSDAYGKESIDANGHYQTWDGCGIEHLEHRLRQIGIDPERED